MVVDKLNDCTYSLNRVPLVASFRFPKNKKTKNILTE